MTSLKRSLGRRSTSSEAQRRARMRPHLVNLTRLCESLTQSDILCVLTRSGGVNVHPLEQDDADRLEAVQGRSASNLDRKSLTDSEKVLHVCELLSDGHTCRPLGTFVLLPRGGGIAVNSAGGSS